MMTYYSTKTETNIFKPVFIAYVFLEHKQCQVSIFQQFHLIAFRLKKSTRVRKVASTTTSRLIFDGLLKSFITT